MVGNSKNTDHESDLRKKLEEIELMINTTLIFREGISCGEIRITRTNRIEIYR